MSQGVIPFPQVGFLFGQSTLRFCGRATKRNEKRVAPAGTMMVVATSLLGRYIMERARRSAAVQPLRTLLSAGATCGLSDAQLLERFVSSSGESAESAFEALVLRHGPMVFEVC